MKKEYVIAMGVNRKNSGYKFTKHKSYEILGWFGRSAEVLDDDGKRCFIAVGAPTMRLDDGQFVKVNFPHAQEAVEYAQRTAAQSIRDLSNGSGWRITKDADIQIKSEKDSGWRITKDAEMHKLDCIAAEAVIDRLYDIFKEARNPDQLVALARQAKIFSDAFKEMQKL